MIKIPAPTRVSAEARGKLRLFKQQYCRTDMPRSLRAALKQATIEIVMPHSARGRRREFDRINAKMSKFARLEDRRLSGKHPLVMWSYLQNRNAVIANPDPALGDAQPCISIDYLLIGSILDADGRDYISQCSGFWSVEFSDHTVARLIDGCPNADIRSVLYECHDSLMRTSIWATRAAMATGDALLIKAGPGVMIADPRYGQTTDDDPDNRLFYFRAKTWVHNDRLREDQRPEPQVVGEQSLGANWLRPRRLRTTVHNSEGFGFVWSERDHDFAVPTDADLEP